MEALSKLLCDTFVTLPASRFESLWQKMNLKGNKNIF
jgi:hypothetical protein